MMLTEQPGLVDLQVNGYGGFDVNAPDASVDDIYELTSALWARGTTTFLAAVITASEERMIGSMRAVARARRGDSRIAHSLAGVHVEGPFISALPGARGAHDPQHVRPPSLDELDRWQDAADGAIRMVTIAAEAAGAAEFIAGARARGVLVSLGHSAAEPEHIRDAVRAGATLSTHLGNGAMMTLPRHPNLLWTQLADDSLTAMFITDGHHLAADTATVMLRAKGLARTVLTSDSAALAGMAAGDYDTVVGGHVRVEADGRLNLGDSGMLAGSGRSLLECLDWAAVSLPFSREQLLPCASEIPAAIIGVPERAALGGDRVLVELQDGRSRVRSVIAGGELVYQAGAQNLSTAGRL